MVRGVLLKVRRPQKEEWHQQLRVGNHAFNKNTNLPSPFSILVCFDLCDKPLPDDPTRRLGIQIEGENEEGTHFVMWTHGNGVMSLNTLIDEIEGRTLWDIAKLPRRWLPAAKAEWRPASTYTSLLIQLLISTTLINSLRWCVSNQLYEICVEAQRKLQESVVSVSQLQSIYDHAVLLLDQKSLRQTNLLFSRMFARYHCILNIVV